MERLIRKYDKECMKMTLLKHEETFRQQVHELHRLYRVQGFLMHDMKNNQLKKQRIRNRIQATSGDHENIMTTCLTRTSQNQKIPRCALSLDLPADEYIEKAQQDRVLEIEREIDIELTLNTGNYCRNKGDAHFTPDSGLSFSSPSSSSSTESGDLKFTGHEWTGQHTEEVDICYRNRIKHYYHYDEGMIREDKMRQAPWLLQCLSLKLA